ncbi:hypothetical protein G7Y89_g6001 [Cudoniella acicularis]|uniref:Uncharacterized protein n=1 Tax=Cudoniella acicularis TaxID=354080 RepID=A0A8H4RNJ6_9HELO|nr:hypothetical protein G7Y89_g6001 [Cudoniella acicularis]
MYPPREGSEKRRMVRSIRIPVEKHDIEVEVEGEMRGNVLEERDAGTKKSRFTKCSAVFARRDANANKPKIRSMATFATTGIELDYQPLTPPTLNCYSDAPTSKSIKIHDSHTIGPSPRRGRLLGTLKALRSRSRSRAGDDNAEHEVSPSRRKSGWEFFATLRYRRAPGGNENENQESHSRARTASPSKKDASYGKNIKARFTFCPDFLKGDFPNRPQRRKSLSDILGTISNKVSSKRGVGFQSTGTTEQHVGISSEENNELAGSHVYEAPYAESVIENEPDPTTAAQNASEPAPALAVGLPGACFDDIDDFASRMERMVDSYKVMQTEELLDRRRDSESSSSTWRSGTRTLVDCTAKQADASRTSENGNRSVTPDSYLNLLIESHNTSPNAIYSFQDSPSSSPNKYRAVQATDFLDDAHSEPGNRRYSLVDKIYMHDIKATTLFVCGEGSKFEPINYRDQGPKITIREVDSEPSVEDLDPNFRCRSDIRNRRYQKLAISSNNNMSDAERLDRSIKLTVARMTKNFHSSSSYEETSSSAVESDEDEKELSSFAQDESKVQQAIAIGEQILNKKVRSDARATGAGADSAVKNTYQRLKRIPSSKEAPQCVNYMDKMLRETIELRSPSETSRGDDFTSQHAKKNALECKSSVSEHSSNEYTNSGGQKQTKAGFKPCNQDQLRLPLKRVTRPALSKQTRHMSIGPVQIKFPALKGHPANKREYADKSEAISILYEMSWNGNYANFCTFDPENRVIQAYPRSSMVPGIEALEESGHEIMWLPMPEGFPLPDGYSRGTQVSANIQTSPEHTDLAGFMDNNNLDSTYSTSNTILDQDNMFDNGPYASLYDVETAFLDVSRLNSKASNPIMVSKQNNGVLKDEDSVSGNEFDFDFEVDSKVVRGLQGNQRLETSRFSTVGDDALSLGNHEELLFDLEDCGDTPPSKTWFDLARAYLSTTSNDGDSESSSIASMPMGLTREIQSSLRDTDGDLRLRGGFARRDGNVSVDLSQRSSSYGIEFEHIEDVDLENKSQFEKVVATVATSELLDPFTEDVSVQQVNENSRSSSISYTSYIEAELASSSLYQSPLEIRRKPYVIVDEPTTLKESSGGASSPGSFASGFRFTEFAAQLPDGSLRNASTTSLENRDERVPSEQEYTSIFRDLESVSMLQESTDFPPAVTPDDLNIRVPTFKGAQSFLVVRHPSQERPSQPAPAYNPPKPFYGFVASEGSSSLGFPLRQRCQTPVSVSNSGISDAGTETSSAFGETLETQEKRQDYGAQETDERDNAFYG